MRSFAVVASAALLAGYCAVTEPAFGAGKSRAATGGGKPFAHHRHAHPRRFVGATGVFVGSGYYAGSYIVREAMPTLHYVERADEADQPPGWLFCPGANAFFPTVVECTSGWLSVPTQP